MVAGKNILLVEDEIIIAETEALQLKKAGYEVLHVPSGESAVDIVAASTAIDLILMDIDLGEGMDGTEAAERILKIKEIPIVFLSAHTEPEIVEKTEKISSYGYVVKAGGPTVLLASIKMAFRLFEAKRALDEKNAELETMNEELHQMLEELEASNEEYARAQDEILSREQMIDFERRQLIAVLDTIPEPIYVCDMDTYEILYINKFFRAIVQKDIIGRKCYEEFHGLDAPCDFCTNEILRRNPDMPYTWEFYNKKLNRHFMLTDTIINWPDGRKVRFEIARDVTKQKESFQEIQRYNQRLRRAEFVSKSGNWEFHLATGEVFASDGARAIYGIGTAKWSISEIQKIPLPEFRPLLDKALKGLVHEGKPYDVEFKIRRPDNGEIVDIHSVAEYDNTRQIIFGVIQDVTEKKRNEEKYRAIVENAGEAIVVALEGKLVYTNPKTVDLLGYDAEFLYSRPFIEFIHPDDREMVFANYSRRIKGEPAPSMYEFRVMHRTGEVRHVEIRPVVIPWEGGVATLNMLTDITERKKLQEFLKSQLLFLENLLEAIPYPVFYKDVEGRYLGCNRAFADYIGQRSEDIVGKTVFDIAPRELAEVYDEMDRMLLQKGGTQRYESEVKSAHGDLRFVVFHKATYPAPDGAMGGIIGTIIDITEEKKAEEKVIVAMQESDILREKAEKLAHEKETLLKEVHHRIKNNLSTIISLLAMQADRLEQRTAKEALILARTRVQSMAVLYDKLYSGENYKSMNLAIYLKTLVNELVSFYPAGEFVNIRYDIAPVELLAKQLLPLGLIVNELVTNAMKYAFPEKKSGEIHIGTYAKNGMILLSISDNGVGLPAHVLEGRSKGFGIELVGLLVKQLKGTLRMENNGGAKFSIEFEKIG